MKIAVLGANGQVGAEVCLILARRPDVSLVPVCRNRLGSAFLRYSGLACRHGLPADESQAARLFGDCDVIANFALGAGSPREAHDQNVRLIENSVRFSRASARVLFFSTLAVYGDPSPDVRFRWKNAYAREKLRCERHALTFGRQHGTETFVLRLGHVCGELQNITAQLREAIRAGAIGVPDPDRPSNATHTAAIADAIVAAGRGSDPPGVYDLVNRPNWSWRELLEHEGRRIGVTPTIHETAAHVARSGLGRRALGATIRLLTSSERLKETVTQLVARLSPRLNQRIKADYYRNRASAEIAALQRAEIPTDAMEWRALGERPLPSLTPTAELLADEGWRVPDQLDERAWPEDLPEAPPRV